MDIELGLFHWDPLENLTEEFVTLITSLTEKQKVKKTERPHQKMFRN